MKLSLNWVKQFAKVEISLAELIDKIGTQLGAVEEVEDVGKKYQGIVIARVVSCQPHPNAGKLSVCLLDDGGQVEKVNRGDNGYIQVVCGAPNVRADQLVAWLPPGSIVPSTYLKEPMRLEARDIRGQISNGMIGSAHELALGDDHDGILVIEAAKVKPGMDFAKAFELDDHVIDIENKMFTHRPDCFGTLGLAREIAGIQQNSFTSPDWYKLTTKRGSSNELQIDNQVPKLCPRYMAVVVHDVKVGPSPLWLQSVLTRMGLRPINNIVDMTNYIMLLTAQPLHAFDFDKVAKDGKAKIVIRRLKKGEKMVLLDGKAVTPRPEAVLICDQDKPIALGGVMGGNNSEVDTGTTSIIIECANFDMYNIRKTAMEHGIFSDAVTRFIKGQSSLQCPAVLDKALQITKQLCPEASFGQPLDAHRSLPSPSKVTVAASFINARLGLTLSPAAMARLLTNVEFKVVISRDILTITTPFWRTDIAIAEDIVEEVGRLYGYDHLPLSLPIKSIKPAPLDQLLATKSKLRSVLSRLGANELLTYSFVHGDLLTAAGQDPAHAFKLSNALSPDLQYYRLSLLPSLLEKVHLNVKQGFSQFALFEINPVHAKGFVGKDKLPEEDQRLALVFAADDKLAAKDYYGAAYYQAGHYLTSLLEGLGITDLRFDMAAVHKPKLAISQAAIAPFDKGRSAIVKTKSGEFIGELGEFRASLRQALKLPRFTAGFELDVQQLLKLMPSSGNYQPLSPYPWVEQDISLKVPTALSYGELYNFVGGQVSQAELSNADFSFTPLDIYQPKTGGHKHIALRLKIVSAVRTLTASEINTLLDVVAAKAKQKFGAERL